VTLNWTRLPPHALYVLYLDLSTRQLRFQSAERQAGPDYPGDSDGERAAEARIITFWDQFADELLLPPKMHREARDFDLLGSWSLWSFAPHKWRGIRFVTSHLVTTI
jgi:hypothetical protein